MANKGFYITSLPFLPANTGADIKSLFCSAPRTKDLDTYCYYNSSGLASFSVGRSSEYFRATSYVIAANLV